MNEATNTRVEFELTPEQVAIIDAFQHKESLPSRAKTIELLLDIAIETVTGTGRRFWDKPIIDRNE
jgi:hypothetical protein